MMHTDFAAVKTDLVEIVSFVLFLRVLVTIVLDEFGLL